jgi:hypothetical protein
LERTRARIAAGSGRIERGVNPTGSKVAQKRKTVRQPGAGSKREHAERVNGRLSGVRTASDEQFKKAHRKTSTLHAGLFRRLAE